MRFRCAKLILGKQGRHYSRKLVFMFAPEEEDMKATVTLLMKQLGNTDARDHRPSASYSPPYFIYPLRPPPPPRPTPPPPPASFFSFPSLFSLSKFRENPGHVWYGRHISLLLSLSIRPTPCFSLMCKR